MKTFKRFWPAGILILLLMILGLPHFRRLMVLGPEYTTLLIGIPEIIPTGLEETYAYATLANRVRFDQPINDPYVWEYRNYVSPFLSELAPAVILGNLAKLTDLPLAFVFFKILGPIILIFLFREISRKAGYSQWLSVTAAVAAVFIPKLFALFPYPAIFTYLSKSSDLEFQRLFHPLLSWIVAAGCFLGIQSVFRSKFSLAKTAAAGMLVGVLFYSYFFVWTFVWFGLVILAVLLFWQRKYSDLKQLTVVMIIGLGIGAPYFVNGWGFSRTVLGQEFWEKTLLPIREIHAVTLLRYVLLAGGIILIDRGWWHQPNKLLLWSMLSAAILLPDLSQLVLGANLESDHWIGRFLYPLSTFLAVLAVGGFLEKRKIRWGWVAILGILTAAILRMALVSVNQWKQPTGSFQLGKNRRELYEFLVKNIPADNIVGSLSFTEQIYLAAYTPFYPFLPRWERTLAFKTEPMERLIFLAQQLKVSENYFDDVMPVPLVPVAHLQLPAFDQKALAMVFGIDYLFDQPPYGRHQQLLNQVKQRYQQPIANPGKLDYLLIGPTDREFSGKIFETECRPMFNNIMYQLYLFEECGGEK